MLSSKKIKQVTSVGLSLFNYQDDARSNKHKKEAYSRADNDASSYPQYCGGPHFFSNIASTLNSGISLCAFLLNKEHHY
jgi:hypothetical protein